MVDHPLEKAGVFAVRMAKPLAENLRRTIMRQPLLSYRPQQRWLALISTGDRHAVASRGNFYARGDLVWRWKDWIDRRFMRKFTELSALPMAGGPQLLEEIPLDEPGKDPGHFGHRHALRRLRRQGRCFRAVAGAGQSASPGARRCADRPACARRCRRGCACRRAWPWCRPSTFSGLSSTTPGCLAASPPIMRSATSLRWAPKRKSATAIATVPPGLESKVEDTVFQMMSGAVSVLNEAGCALVGGHTGEGKELALGFAINGLIDETLSKVMRKGGMQPGDVLILTKPIGTGTLFAAHARLQAAGRWIDAALDSMQVSNRAAVPCLIAHGATACTDLTGFGLLGHLVEMTRASGVDAELELAALPILDGAVDTVLAGIFSSLQPANVRLRRALHNPEAFINHPRYPLLFDPQTAGGLLASVPAESVDACLAELHNLGYLKAVRIGRILPQGEALEPILSAICADLQACEVSTALIKLTTAFQV
jgi:selenide,water dikinase